jgi:hypothetical protein
MKINEPSVVAEVRALFERYEAALMANDIAALDGFFWRSQFALRFGQGENLYGYDAIAAFRVRRLGGSPPRTLFNTVITTFGDAYAVTNTEFRRDNVARSGRQSQTWVRLAEGWRIVSAHVSMLGDAS